MIYQIPKKGNCLGPSGKGVIACQDRMQAIVKGNHTKEGIKKDFKKKSFLVLMKRTVRLLKKLNAYLLPEKQNADRDEHKDRHDVAKDSCPS